jgi:antitoxin component YwqK of YwqJK toxin-antitoxin module
MTQLPKDIYSVIADFIPDIKTWYNYCLSNKLVWSACKFKVKKIQNRFTYEDKRDIGGVFETGVFETFVRLKHNDKPHGKYERSIVQYTIPQRVLQETGWYSNGKKNGTFIKYHVLSGRKVWECSFKDDLKHGEEYIYVHMFLSDKPTELTTWYLGKKNGPSVNYAYSETGEQIVTCYELWAHGKLLESTKYQVVDPKKKFILEYIQLPDGKHQVYYPGSTNLKSQTSYIAGKKHGSHTEYNIDGTLSLSEMYAEGRLVEHHFGTGKPFNNGENNGWRRFYDENGKFLHKCRYIRGNYVPKSWSSEP